MRMTCYDTRKAARKHVCLHHMILEKRREAAREPMGSHHATRSLLKVPPLFVLVEYGLGVL